MIRRPTPVVIETNLNSATRPTRIAKALGVAKRAVALDGSAWAVLLLVVYPLVQLPVVVYLSRYVELGEGESPAGSPRGYAFAEENDGPLEPVAAAVGPGVTCGRCGAANDADFRYCRNCLTRLA